MNSTVVMHGFHPVRTKELARHELICGSDIFFLLAERSASGHRSEAGLASETLSRHLKTLFMTLQDAVLTHTHSLNSQHSI